MTAFDRTTVLHPTGPSSFVAELDPTWASLRGVHGGYVTALVVRAAEGMFPDRAVRTVATSFLRPTQIGAAELVVDVVRSGRSLSTLAVSVRQGGREAVRSSVTMASPVSGADWTTSVRDRPAPLASCVPFTPPPSISHFSHAELRIDPAAAPTGDAHDARIAGHVRPNEPRPFDAPWLAMIGDWFPPSAFRRVAPPIGGVSIDYVAHIHRTLPAGGLWLEGVFDARVSVDGVALEHGTVATPDGMLVLETFHTRWTG